MEAKTPNRICNAIKRYQEHERNQTEREGDVFDKIIGIGRLIERICWKRGEHHGKSVIDRLRC